MVRCGTVRYPMLPFGITIYRMTVSSSDDKEKKGKERDKERRRNKRGKQEKRKRGNPTNSLDKVWIAIEWMLLMCLCVSEEYEEN